jgi:Sulfatase
LYGTFFQGGVNFIDAETVRTSTTPGYASMLTGLYPFRHGVRQRYYVLNDAVDTLPEILARQGYTTAGFVSSFVMVGRCSGLQQGFQDDDKVQERELLRHNYERTASNTVQKVLLWLEKNYRKTPFFLFLHFIDPHGPYHPPDNFKTFRHSFTKPIKREKIPAYQFMPPLLDLYGYVDLYDGEIAYLDSQLNQLYSL